jgi:hypothetical protein
MAGTAKPTPAVNTVTAVQSFVGSLDGKRIDFQKGEPVPGDHPAVKKWPQLFTPQEYRHEVIERIEAATAAPGEKRGT